MILFIYRIDRANVGDANCCPADYLDFSRFGPLERLDITEVGSEEATAKIKAAAAVIVGGGGIYHFPGELAHILGNNDRVIAWGIGTNTHDRKDGVLDYGECPPERFALAGIRDYFPFDHPASWVPCVSCMSPLFDPMYSELCSFVLYAHKDLPLNLAGFDSPVPQMTNGVKTLREAVEFIAMGRKTITNSYHGVYWSHLLGRRPVVYQPFSSKFFHMAWPAPHAWTELDVPLCLDHASWQPHALTNSRQANQEFASKVFELLDLHAR